MTANQAEDAHIRSFLRSLQDPTPPDELDLGFVEQAIMRRVRQGVPLEAIHHAFRIGHLVLWAAGVDHASGISGGRAAAILIVQPSIRYIDTVSTRVAEAYLREQQGALADPTASAETCSSSCSRVGRGQHWRPRRPGSSSATVLTSCSRRRCGHPAISTRCGRSQRR
jgi:hypothetical protein